METGLDGYGDTTVHFWYFAGMTAQNIVQYAVRLICTLIIDLDKL